MPAMWSLDRPARLTSEPKEKRKAADHTGDPAASTWCARLDLNQHGIAPANPSS